MELIAFEVDGKKLTGILHKPEINNKAGIVMVHGFKGNKDEYGRFTKAAERFCNDGFTVLRFNCRGTPDSKGEFKNMTIQTEVEDLVAAIDFLKEQEVNSIGVLGHSMGGEITILGSLERDLKAIVLWAPASSSEIWKWKFTKEQIHDIETKGETIFYGTKTGLPWTVGRGFYESAMNTRIEDKLGTIKVPTLIIHGDKDVNVPLKYSKKAIQKINSTKELKVIEGADHYFLEQLDEFIELSVNWFKKYL